MDRCSRECISWEKVRQGEGGWEGGERKGSRERIYKRFRQGLGFGL